MQFRARVRPIKPDLPIPYIDVIHRFVFHPYFGKPLLHFRTFVCFKIYSIQNKFHISFFLLFTTINFIPFSYYSSTILILLKYHSHTTCVPFAYYLCTILILLVYCSHTIRVNRNRLPECGVFECSLHWYNLFRTGDNAILSILFLQSLLMCIKSLCIHASYIFCTYIYISYIQTCIHKYIIYSTYVPPGNFIFYA